MLVIREGPVLKISPLVLLFLVQFLLIFLGLTIFLFLQYKKLRVKELIARGEAGRLRAELENAERINDHASGLEDKFSDLQKKFDQVKTINEKLKDAINKLIPEGKRTKEHEQAINDIEQSYAEFDSFIGILRKEKETLSAQSKVFKLDISKLSQRLEHSVSKDDYDKLNSQKKSLELKFAKLKKDLEDKAKEHESLQKNYVWLEKEYNALYDNINDTNS